MNRRTTAVKEIVIRAVRPSDTAAWVKLRTALWPDGAEDHPREVAQFFAGMIDEPNAAFIVENPAGKPIAILELSIREDVQGLEGKRAGYVEGLYVIPELRHRGIAADLLHTSLNWARENQCVAFASDRAERMVVYRRFAVHTVRPRRSSS
jgi:aminoglycoside 6'-N-acetyltransferase I